MHEITIQLSQNISSNLNYQISTLKAIGYDYKKKYIKTRFWTNKKVDIDKNIYDF